MGWLGSLIASLLFSLVCASAIYADIDPSEYELKSSIRSEKERERFRLQLEKSRAEEVEHERAQAEIEARQQAEEKERLAARPYPVKLLEARCTKCHAATHYENQNHTWLGWLLVAVRMEYFNDAILNPGDRKVIVAHLAETYPANGSDALIEWLAQLLAALGPIGAWLLFRGVRGAILKRRTRG